jgi:3'-5' exoribonuclease
MEHVFINQITSGQTINDIYMVKDPILRSTTRGDMYIAMYVCDRTGQLNGRMWQATEAVYTSLPKPGFVHIKGRSELYQSNLQIVINSVRVVDPQQICLDDFLPATDKNVELMYKEVIDMLARITNPQLKALIEAFCGDQALMDKFCKSPAAIKMHHAYLGGLLEHTHNMLRVACAILPLYPQIQADLVLAGILLHDMCKTDELTCDMAFSYTDSGQLIGHLVKGIVLVNKKADMLRQQGQEIDQELIDALSHIILSHHGQLEFGSPKLPATAEAFMINYIDNLDAKMNQVTTAIENDLGDTNWTAWQNSLQTRLYRKRVQ